MTRALHTEVLRRAMQLYAEALGAHRDELNSLNVYPVPDGDTGTNMLLTQEAVVAALEGLPGSPSLLEIGATVSRTSLLGARGNSGVILSQVLRGLFDGLPSTGPIGPGQLSEGLRRAADEAYRAVARPVEGTVLTVLRDAAEAALEAAHRGEDCAAVAEGALRGARASLDRTPDALPDLQRAGVVDAGGKGIVLLLDALRAALLDEPLSEPVGALGPVGREPAAEAAARDDFGFEVQYLLEVPDESMRQLRLALDSLGGSLVVVGGGGLFNVHVHTDRPGRAVEAALEAGRPRNISIVSLDGQVAACIGGQARAVQAAAQTCALVAVAQGDGLVRALASLGAVVVPGGHTPSVQELQSAIEAAPAHEVAVLLSDADVLSAAERAAAASSKQALMVPAGSVPAGLAAATAFNPMVSVRENAKAMREAVALCRSGELARADRDAMTPAGAVRKGDWMGMSAGEVVATGGSLEAAAAEVARHLAGGSPEILTLVVGDGASVEEREAVGAALREALPELTVEVVEGGQPGSPFLIGVE